MQQAGSFKYLRFTNESTAMTFLRQHLHDTNNAISATENLHDG